MFLDLKKLTDEELSNKISDAYRRLTVVQQLGNNAQIVNQLYTIIDSMEFERTERTNLKMVEMYSKQFPEIIESDPEFQKNGNKPEQNNQNGRQRTVIQPKFLKSYASGAPPKSDTGKPATESSTPAKHNEPKRRRKSPPKTKV